MTINRALKSSMVCLQRLAGRLILICVVPAAGLWMILAVWFSNLPGSILPGVVAVALGVVILVILARVKGCWQVCGLVCSLFTVIYIWHYFTPPSNDRNWQPSVARLATARFSEAGDLVTVHNIRNFEYRSARDFDIRYYDQTFDLKQLRGVDLIISYWGHDAMAHTFLSFVFAEDIHLAISIEIRPEIGEVYHPLAGLFKQYEIIYVVGDERDLIRLRSNHRGEETYLYPSTATADQARRLFVDMLTRVNQLAQKPAFYGTIRQNCTTALVEHVNKVLDHEIPFSGQLLFNGFSDRLAFVNGNIRKDLPFPDLKAACYISGIAKTLEQDPAFSKNIRAHMHR